LRRVPCSRESYKRARVTNEKATRQQGGLFFKGE
jgi:hypothetical protein